MIETSELFRVRARSWACSAPLLSLVLSACSFAKPLVGVTEVDPERVHAEINASALTGKELSSATREILRVYDLETLYEEDQLAAVRALHERALEEPSRGLDFALAETCFLAAKAQGPGGLHAPPRAYVSESARTGVQAADWYLATVVYANTYLLGKEDPTPPNPYDRRFRWACDLYNRGLQGAFTSKDGEHFELTGGVRTLPVGTLRVSVDRSEFPWDEERIDSFLMADRFLVDGLSVRLRDSGLGVPLIGLRAQTNVKPQRIQRDIANAPATAFLRFQGALRDLESGIDAVLELHSGYDASNLVVAGEQVPLETDRSALLAYVLDRPAIWKFSIRGLFSSGEASGENSLIFVQPYQPGRVPIVFVHPAEFLVTAPDGAILRRELLGDRLLIDPSQEGDAPDQNRVFTIDLPLPARPAAVVAPDR